jgi:hypothetical protein
MANAELESTSPPSAGDQLESGAYEIIRGRLRGHGQELRKRLEQLNAARKEVFGSIDTVLLATDRITTAHHCIPRDLAALKNRFLFGYNVHFGLKTTTAPEDVFGVYELRDQAFHELELDLISDPQFVRDFGEIYRYYKDATFSRFYAPTGFLYMVFQVGRTPQDIKALKWQVRGDKLVYVDNRSDHEVRLPPQHEFQWQRTRREQHRFGRHPHVAIEDRLFVETIGGDLTIKVENNTDSGAGIYAEDVKDKDQTLDDAEIYYAIVGNLILLKIRPYNESDFRYIVFNEKTRQARRWDAIRHCGILLPDDHGLIFPNGFFLQSGEAKMFDNAPGSMVFENRTAASNGEDYLYCFRNLHTGETALLQYNVIEQQVNTPLLCHGATLLHGGELICFKHEEEPQRHHALQIWQTPHHSEEMTATTAQTESFLYKVGNRDIVRGMAECHEVLNLIEKDDSYSNLYLDLVKSCGDIVDSYFWLDREETANLRDPLVQIRETAGAAIEEFEKVIRVRKNTRQQTEDKQQRVRDVVATIQRHRFDTIDQFVTSLSELRGLRGEIIGLRELRYVDLELVDKLETQVAEETQRLSQRCVQFLLQPSSLAPYEKQVAEHAEQVAQLKTVAEAKRLEQEVSTNAGELEMLIDVVGNLKIDDATQRTAIVDGISAIFAKINHTRSQIRARQKELMSAEGIAEFNSQLKLLNQAIVNYLEVCDTPAKCDELLTRLAIQIEELEGRFAEFDEFVVQLADKRDEVYNAFETRKLGLIEARNRRAAALANAADRILRGIQGRLESLGSINEIHAYFASDLMIAKVRDIIQQLTDLEDSVRVDDIQSRLRALREDAIRQLKDRQELFVAGENVIKFGRHHFAVNVQPLDLTTILRDGRVQLHLTGTNFFEPLEDDDIASARDLWQQELISENGEIYRGEFLAYRLFQTLDTAGGFESARLLKMGDEERIDWVRQFMGPRYQEGYVKGVHDADAARIVRAMAEMKGMIGLLQYHPQARALAKAYWKYCCPPREKSRLGALLRGHSAVLSQFPRPEQREAYTRELAEVLEQFATESPQFDIAFAREAASYLYEECVRDVGFVISRTAAELHDTFFTRLRGQQGLDTFRKSMSAATTDPLLALRLARDWAEAFVADCEAVAAGDNDDPPTDRSMYVNEFSLLLLEDKLDTAKIVDGLVHRHLTGLAGAHAVIRQGKYDLHYNRFLTRLAEYDRQVVPRFERFSQRKKELVEQSRERLRLDDFQAKVLTSFVRNKLIDTVYLPLIGDNLAKQIGAAGDQKRSDRSGLLLLVSPPGYGKTTLMEYIANRLGLVFMKINGPAIGHQVTSLDPSEANNAAAREELERLNLALEMGDNVMLYLDDIQHCHTELLQKFISLCDAQRKIEGVYRGRTRTYDLRGRKVAVVMAGNPYTESGEKFQIPDMLANRADIYNLGEIIGDTREAFELSYLENCLTSNPTLGKLASRSQQDIYTIIRFAETGDRNSGELEGNYSPDELNEMIQVLEKLLQVRDVILTVNREYIRSAAQADEYRTEPPFKLQGSYRNMNRIAEKVVPIMNEKELRELILANYENDSQTLASDTESNMLKFKELIGILSPEEHKRWEEIRRTFRQNLKLHGIGSDDKAGLVIAQLGTLTDGLESIRQALLTGTTELTRHAPASEVLADHLERLAMQLETLRQQGVEALDQAASRLAAGQVPGSSPAVPTDESAQRLIVQHKVPRSILDVVQNQFNMMQQWLVPLKESTAKQGAEFQQLQKSIHDCLASYEQLLGELENARRRGKR